MRTYTAEEILTKSLEWPDLRQRLHRAMIVERAFRRPDRLAHHLAQQPKITRDRLDRLAAGMLAPDPNHCLHHQHPDLAAWSDQAAYAIE